MKYKISSIAGNFHYLFRNLYQYRRGSILLPFAGSILQILLSLVAIWIPKIILNLLSGRAACATLLFWIAAGTSVLFLVSLANSVIHNEITSCSQGFIYTCLVRHWEEKMMDLDYEIFTSRSGKIHAEKARNSINSPNWGISAYLHSMTELLGSIGVFLSYSAVICVLHPFILFWLILLFGVEMWFSAVTEHRKQSMKEERAVADRKLNYIAYGTKGIQEGKDIRMYTMTSWLRKIAQSAIKEKEHVEKKAARWEMQKLLLNGFLIFLRNGCAYLYLIDQFFHAGMPIGDFTLYFAAITGLGDWLGKLTRAVSGFIEADHYAADFRQFMMLDEKKQAPKYDTDILTRPLSFTWEHVSFSYYEIKENGEQKEIPVIKDLCLSIKAGEKLAIVGTNGAGKTTFVKLLCGFLTPKEGRILVNGYPIEDFGIEDYRSLFSAVFQKSGVLPVSIRDNIALNIRGEATDVEILRCIRLASLEEKVLSLPKGMDTCLVKRISEQGTELSGGELQRLLLARALFKNAPVLILDEPTAALDPIAENEIYQKYNQFTEEKTAVFISHRLASTRFCDRIIVLDHGKIAEMGTHDELLRLNGKYAEMFQVQSQYYTEASKADQGASYTSFPDTQETTTVSPSAPHIQSPGLGLNKKEKSLSVSPSAPRTQPPGLGPDKNGESLSVSNLRQTESCVLQVDPFTTEACDKEELTR